MLEIPKNHIDYQGETNMDETMGNQQEILTEGEIGWLAGIIEGEGSITLNVRKKKWKGWKGIGVDLSVYIVNSDGGIIENASRILNKMDVNPHLFERKAVPLFHGSGKQYVSTKTMLTVNVSKMKDILRVLTIIQPYLAGEKKSRANLMTQFIKRRLDYKGPRSNQHKNTAGQSWYTGYDWELVRKFYKISGGKLLPEVQEILNDHTSPTVNA